MSAADLPQSAWQPAAYGGALHQAAAWEEYGKSPGLALTSYYFQSAYVLRLTFVRKIGGNQRVWARLAAAFEFPLGFIPFPKFRGWFNR